MKEICGITANTLILIEEDGLTPMSEMIISLSEPQSRHDEAGGLTKYRSVEDVRFVASVDTLRKLIKACKARIDILEGIREAESDLDDPEKPEESDE